MTEKERLTIKIEEDLAHEIDRVISIAKRFGVTKYRSRAEFARIACLKLLGEENEIMKNGQKISTKKLGEEILVTRK